ncbi:MAG: hypothetical protein R3C05_10485 [Pirellulaceae bacterium]
MLFLHWEFSTTDPAGKKSRTISDAMGRTITQIDNYQASGSGTDVNVTTEYTTPPMAKSRR